MSPPAEAAASELEALLRRALAPVDPPDDLVERVESTLADLHGAAAEELENWELSAMRDPRNWARPVAAAAMTLGAGSALVLVRTRQRASRRGQPTGVLDAIEQTVSDLATETRRLVDR